MTAPKIKPCGSVTVTVAGCTGVGGSTIPRNTFGFNFAGGVGAEAMSSSDRN